MIIDDISQNYLKFRKYANKTLTNLFIDLISTKTLPNLFIDLYNLLSKLLIKKSHIFSNCSPKHLKIKYFKENYERHHMLTTKNG